MLLSSLALALFLSPLLTAAQNGQNSQAVRSCIPSGNEEPINAAFKKGGVGTTVTLCSGSVHRLNSSILFTAEKQTLTTENDEKGLDRALLIVEGADQAAAIRADCQQCSHATIKSLIIDGNRPQLLRIPKGDALIEIGNAEYQLVKDCKLYEPRGWSALHFREGDRKQCRYGKVINNEIGPCGEEWDDDYDGENELEPPFGNPRSDGISLACKDSLVEKNIVYDTTDGAIVLFGSAGSEVRNNHIYSRTRVVLGGINLVDYDPWQGDYMLVNVHHNHLHAFGRYFKVGIVIGPSSWSDDTESTVHSASVTDNYLEGEHFGYGIVVSSATSFTVLRNTIGEISKFRGVNGPRCPKAPENGKPTAFLINRGSAKGTFQDDFVNGEVQHIICLNMPDENGRAYTPWRFRDSPAAIAAKAASGDSASDPIVQAAFDARIAEALVTYQFALTSAMDAINDKIERLTNPITEDDFKVPTYKHEHELTEKPKKLSSSGNRDIDELSNKLELLEQSGRKLKKNFDGLKGDFEGLSGRLKKGADDTKPIIESIFTQIQSILSGSTPLMTAKQILSQRDTNSSTFASHGLINSIPFGIYGVIFGSALLLFIASNRIKRLRKGGVKTNKVF
ncbi:uncharacterized protein I303_105189 [Kwoniella dejecticola CBS 10117]|uniref:Right handed beta helix domain-containing protein n=1 Tax=Kwoniella dejecticola CBS 10117 TaxID=1296121 RepID=A0A1A6A378_9TREE|nr:uncharacterized protein I303_05364 [Kwoniella dejecticola CBS 10117]OBR84506.1 hypothetical protein I303_05364 [Kwoniella dejecticola CBS 10117]